MKDIIHMICYGNENFENAKRRIYKEALDTNWFSSIKCYGPDNLSDSFKDEFKSILKLKRGGGYWVWKFLIILNRLKEINEGEFLVYLDSGCTINAKGAKRFYEYIESIKNNKHKILSFQLHHKENIWTTKQIFEAFNVEENDPIRTTGQIISGIIVMQKCEAVVNIFKICFEKLRENPLIITDYYNNVQEPFFKENRHDQSFLSLALKKHGSIVIPDETYSLDFNSEEMQKIPFLATRKR